MRAAIALLCLTMCCVPLSAAAKAKPGRYVVDAKGETVLDTTTKLTWQRVVGQESYNWQAAKDACKALPTAAGGWRLPTVRELGSLVDFGHTNPAIDKTAFPNTPAAAFWSATPKSGTSSLAWFVDSTGMSNANGVIQKARVRCVR